MSARGTVNNPLAVYIGGLRFSAAETEPPPLDVRAACQSCLGFESLSLDTRDGMAYAFFDSPDNVSRAIRALNGSQENGFFCARPQAGSEEEEPSDIASLIKEKERVFVPYTFPDRFRSSHLPKATTVLENTVVLISNINFAGAEAEVRTLCEEMQGLRTLDFRNGHAFAFYESAEEAKECIRLVNAWTPSGSYFLDSGEQDGTDESSQEKEESSLPQVDLHGGFHLDPYGTGVYISNLSGAMEKEIHSLCKEIRDLKRFEFRNQSVSAIALYKNAQDAAKCVQRLCDWGPSGIRAVQVDLAEHEERINLNMNLNDERGRDRSRLMNGSRPQTVKNDLGLFVKFPFRIPDAEKLRLITDKIGPVTKFSFKGYKGYLTMANANLVVKAIHLTGKVTIEGKPVYFERRKPERQLSAHDNDRSRSRSTVRVEIPPSLPSSSSSASSFPPQPRDSTVFIDNLPLDGTEVQIRNLCAKIGVLNRLDFHGSCVWVFYKNAPDAKTCVEKFNNWALPGGQVLCATLREQKPAHGDDDDRGRKLSHSSGREHPLQSVAEANFKVFIGWPPGVSHPEVLKAVTESIGPIVRSELKDGYGFLSLPNAEALQKALKLNDKLFIDGRPVRFQERRGGGRNERSPSRGRDKSRRLSLDRDERVPLRSHVKDNASSLKHELFVSWPPDATPNEAVNLVTESVGNVLGTVFKKGYGFFLMESAEAVERALEMSGSVYIRGRPVIFNRHFENNDERGTRSQSPMHEREKARGRSLDYDARDSPAPPVDLSSGLVMSHIAQGVQESEIIQALEKFVGRVAEIRFTPGNATCLIFMDTELAAQRALELSGMLQIGPQPVSFRIAPHPGSTRDNRSLDVVARSVRDTNLQRAKSFSPSRKRSRSRHRSESRDYRDRSQSRNSWDRDDRDLPVPEAYPAEPPNGVFVQDLPFNVTKDMIGDAFSIVGRVRSVSFRKGYPWCFVFMEHFESVARAIQLDGGIIIRGNRVMVSRKKPKVAEKTKSNSGRYQQGGPKMLQKERKVSYQDRDYDRNRDRDRPYRRSRSRSPSWNRNRGNSRGQYERSRPRSRSRSPSSRRDRRR